MLFLQGSTSLGYRFKSFAQTGETGVRARLGRLRGVLMPSTPSAYPRVVFARFALFRVVEFGISAGHVDFGSGFDSRQLH